MAYTGAKRGAKPKVDDWLTKEGLVLLNGWARDGLSNGQIASNMGVSLSAFYSWKADHTEILEAIKKGKEIVDYEVENALLKRALGYTIEKTKTFVKDDGNGNKVSHVEVTKEQVPPDATSMIFWLKNRKPNEWREKQSIKHTGNINYGIDFSDITTDELRRIAQSNEE